MSDRDLTTLHERAAEALTTASACGVPSSEIRRYAADFASPRPGTPYFVVPASVRAMRDELHGRGGAALVAAVHRLLVLDRIHTSRAVLSARERYADVRPHFEDAVQRIFGVLFDAPDEVLDFAHDAFTKDASVAALRLIPFGAQVVDLHASPGRRTLLESGASTFRTLAPLFVRMGGFAPMFEIHTYDRALHEFNRQGWIECYKRIARFMEGEPGAKGVFGSSWFYDPQLATVSPRLAYLREDPTSGGATFARVRATPHTTSLAISKSSTRKQLFDEGKYLPQQHLMIWPRDELLTWARR